MEKKPTQAYIVSDDDKRNVEVRQEILKKILRGSWYGTNITKLMEKYKLNTQQTKRLADEAYVMAREIMEIEGGKEALREEIIADARFVYKSCMNRKHLRDDIYGRPMHPDVGGATKALALMLKAGGLDVQKHEVVTVDLASCIAQLPHEAREYIALHGELPPGVQLPGFQMRALPEVVPEVVEVVPNEPRIDTNEEAQSLSDEED